MGGSVLDLIATLKLDTSEYDQGLQGLEGSTNDLSGMLSGLGLDGVAALGMIGAAAAGAVAGFEAISEAVQETIEYIWEATNATAEYGDSVDKMSQKLGLSTEAYQELDYVLQLNGTSINQMRGGMKTLVNAFDDAKSGSEGAIDKFERLGLSMDEISNMNQEELFMEVIYGLQNMTDETERSAAANDLLGRSAMELAPLLNSTKEETQGLIEQAHEYGFVMSDEMVDASAKYEDAMLTMQKTFEGIKNNVFGTLLPSFTTAFEGIAQIMAGNTEEGTTALSDGIQNLVSTVSTELPNVINIAGDIFMAFGSAATNALPDVMSAVSNIISSIGAKLPEAIPMVTEMIMQLANVFFENQDALIEAGGTLIEGLGQGLINAMPIIQANMPQLIAGIVDFFVTNQSIMTSVGTELFAALIDNMPAIISVIMAANAEIVPAVVSALTSGSSTGQMANAGVTLITSLIQKLAEGIAKALEVGTNIVSNLVSGLQSLIGNVISTASNIVSNIVTYLQMAIPQVLSIGVNIISNFVSGIRSMIGNVTSAVTSITDGIRSRLMSLPSQMLSIGASIIQGLINGFRSGISGLLSLAQSTANQLTNTVKGALKIHSPSRVFEEIGSLTAEGYGVGWEDEFANVQKQINNDMQFSSSMAATTGAPNGNVQMQMAAGTGDIIIPVYIGQRQIDEIVIDAQNRYNYRSGGR